MNHKAKMSLWHTGDNRYVQAGEMVDLSHLDAGRIAKLIEIDAVEEVAEEPAPTTTRRKSAGEEQG
jgi:hypothetical protein